jgi:hypothetical protein
MFSRLFSSEKGARRKGGTAKKEMIFLPVRKVSMAGFAPLKAGRRERSGRDGGFCAFDRGRGREKQLGVLRGGLR